MYRKLIQISLVLVYLVIVAGAMVRMTGSGMGCPDWPKCFGYYIPPTEISQLQFKADHFYEEGQVIIVNESLKVVQEDFTSNQEFDQKNWENYTRHDYAIFNPMHTWVEYVNRLAGALAGIFVLIMALLSFIKWKDKKRNVLLSWLTVFLMGFQGWLGATVVYSVLNPVKITVHMVMALVIVAVLLYLLQLTSKRSKLQSVKILFKNLLIISIILTLIQVIMGTQVRQFVDDQVKDIGYAGRENWLLHPGLIFYIHRSFSIVVLLINLFLWWKNKKDLLGFRRLNWVMILITVEILTGIAMFYFHFPILSQPLHLVIASILFGIQFYILLEAFRSPFKTKSL